MKTKASRCLGALSIWLACFCGCVLDWWRVEYPYHELMNERKKALRRIAVDEEVKRGVNSSLDSLLCA